MHLQVFFYQRQKKVCNLKELQTNCKLCIWQIDGTKRFRLIEVIIQEI